MGSTRGIGLDLAERFLREGAPRGDRLRTDRLFRPQDFHVFTRALVRELKGSGIRSNAVVSGWIENAAPQDEADPYLAELARVPGALPDSISSPPASRP